MKRRLTYSDTTKKGYSRHRSGKKFVYKNTRGDLIKDERTLRRITGLVIPPAWRRVWICTDAHGHIQCYGYDDRNRKQYIYHSDWSEHRNLRKFKKLSYLGDSLSKLTRQINKDLRQEVWNKEKACALALSLTKETLIRVGNARYTKENKSYGLTTLKKTHLSFQARSARLAYVGKKGVPQEHEIKGKRLCQHLHDLHQIPGSTLFKYYPVTSSRSTVKLKSKEINQYLKAACENKKITIKSLRIWGASVLALQLMIQARENYDKEKAQMQLNEILDQVAVQLGNSRAIAKKYYVHPILQELFLTGKLYRKISKNIPSRTEKQLENLLQKLL